MARNCIVDSGTLVALLDPREMHHDWAVGNLEIMPTPWLTCEAVISEAFYLLRGPYAEALGELLSHGYVQLKFALAEHLSRILELRAKYADVPMSLADACLVRMSEILRDPVVVTTDADFKIYRRHGRQVIPSIMAY